MAVAQAEAHVTGLLDRMFRDHKKDITFQLSDGQEFAHEAVLRAASDVFAQMLEHDFREKSTRTISLPDVSRKVMRVFLRLIYSGSVDKSDWDDAEDRENADRQLRVLEMKRSRGSGEFQEVKMRYDEADDFLKSLTADMEFVNGLKAPEELTGISVLTHRNMRIDGSRLTSTDGGSWALLSGGGTGDFTFSVRAETWEGVEATIGIEPVDGPFFDTGFYCIVCEDSLLKVYGQDGTLGDAFPSRPRLLDGAKVTVKFEGGNLSFAVSGGEFITPPFKGQITRGMEYAPAVSLRYAGTALDIVQGVSQPKAQCPLDALVGAASLAKTYMAKSVYDMCTTALMERVVAAEERKDIGAFQDILASAISVDMGGVRMAALKAAEGFAQLRAEHDAGRLRPEVSEDLCAIWPPAERKRKLERLS